MELNIVAGRRSQKKERYFHSERGEPDYQKGSP